MKLSRRMLLQRGAVLGVVGALAACAPKVVKETVVVEKEKLVEKVVKETVVVAGTPQVVEKVVTVAAPTKAPEQPYQLVIHTRVGTDLDQYFVTVLDQFKQIVPNATVKIEAVPGGALEYAAKVLVLHAGGQIGDALWSASRVGFNRRFMAVGIFKPLDDFVAKERFDVGQYYPNCIEEAKYEGKLMALPHISEPGQVGLVMNLDLFGKAGAKPLTWGSTWDDMLAAAQKITKGNTFGYGNDHNYFNWITRVRSWGGDFLNAEGTKCVLDDQKAQAAIQMQYDMAYKYNCSPAPSAIQGDLSKMFQGGSLAMFACWPINASAWPTQIKDFKVGATMLPPGPGGRGSMLNQHMMSVAAVSKRPEAAWEWVKWTCSRKFSLERALVGKGGPVGMNSVWHDPELLKLYPSWEEWARVMDNVGPNYTAANLRGKELEDAFNQGASAIMVKEVSVKEGFERLRKECQTILDKPIAK